MGHKWSELRSDAESELRGLREQLQAADVARREAETQQQLAEEAAVALRHAYDAEAAGRADIERSLERARAQRAEMAPSMEEAARARAALEKEVEKLQQRVSAASFRSLSPSLRIPRSLRLSLSLSFTNHSQSHYQSLSLPLTTHLPLPYQSLYRSLSIPLPVHLPHLLYLLTLPPI